MRHRGLRQAATPLLVSLGFAAGVAFVASCGGSGSGASAAGAGSLAVRHVYHAPVPSNHAAGTFAPTVVDTVTYTPGSASDVLLRVRMVGNVDVADDSCTLVVSLVIPGFGTTALGQVTLGVGNDQDFTVEGSFPAIGTLTLPATTHDIVVQVAGPFVLPPAPAGTTNVTVNALTLEVIVLEDVDVSDPSPRLQ